MNVAVTAFEPSMLRTQRAEPVQSPDQPLNFQYDDEGVAVRETTVPVVYDAEQTLPQLMPPVELVTYPPGPGFVVTVKVLVPPLTVTVTVAEDVPPGPVHVNVELAETVIGGEVNEPGVLAGTDVPSISHVVALEDDQLIGSVSPDETVHDELAGEPQV